MVSFPATKESLADMYSTVLYPLASHFIAENSLLSLSTKADIKPLFQSARIPSN